jgi:RNA polymerase sigma factor (sigma-70 family)
MRQEGRSSGGASALSRYKAEIGKNSPSVGEQGVKDWRALVEANLTFVLRVASEFRDLGLPFEDLVNEGNCGLIKAAQRYEPERGYKFTTYAVWWIRKSILKALGEQTRVVRVPVYVLRQRKRQHSSKDASSACGGKFNNELPLTELSLEKKIGSDGNISLGDSLADCKTRNPEESLLSNEAQDLVNEAISSLSAQERTVINYRFGLSGDRPLVLKQIGNRLGISRERVRQIEVEAKSRMRRYFARRASIYPTQQGNSFEEAGRLTKSA